MICQLKLNQVPKCNQNIVLLFSLFKNLLNLCLVSTQFFSHPPLHFNETFQFTSQNRFSSQINKIVLLINLMVEDQLKMYSSFINKIRVEILNIISSASKLLQV
ncbi:unnamed protein product [Paramecium octaurelia]|uniref:Uncharacterized protein n=1 Tax=Paramecium octaurelia TaxID=43137 RepID=A0A8S1YN31_PAROT|nr:unnamed protein product [Paramecium octaurelia]